MKSRKILPFLLLAVLMLVSEALSAQRIAKVMHYNILQYGNACNGVILNDKDVWLKTIMDYYQPDILTVNEMASNIAFANRIKVKALSDYGDMEYADLTNLAGSSIINMLFYNKNIFGYGGVTVIPNSLRDINVYTLYDKTTATFAGSDTAFIYCIVTHFKAGSGSSDKNLREIAAESIMSWISSHGAEKNHLLMGDFNLSSSSEDAWQTLIFHPDPTIRLRDPAGVTTGWSGSGFASIHTQSTRSSSPDCGSGGGMDDRFDFILAADGIMTGSDGITYVPGSYSAFGNDGSSWNVELVCNNTPVPTTVCGSLKQMSDHLPVVMQLELPATTGLDDEKELYGFLIRPMENPFGPELRLMLESKAPGDLQIALSDLSGKTLHSRLIRTSEGIQEILLPFASLSPGMYILRASLEGKPYQTLRLLHR
jgi:endonuclease/exonuclease/phosphatase family metal-dependent hydrolase